MFYNTNAIYMVVTIKINMTGVRVPSTLYHINIQIKFPQIVNKPVNLPLGDFN